MVEGHNHAVSCDGEERIVYLRCSAGQVVAAVQEHNDRLVIGRTIALQVQAVFGTNSEGQSQHKCQRVEHGYKFLFPT